MPKQKFQKILEKASREGTITQVGTKRSDRELQQPCFALIKGGYLSGMIGDAHHEPIKNVRLTPKGAQFLVQLNQELGPRADPQEESNFRLILTVGIFASLIVAILFAVRWVP